jgi:hypothetical protein
MWAGLRGLARFARRQHQQQQRLRCADAGRGPAEARKQCFEVMGSSLAFDDAAQVNLENHRGERMHRKAH